MGVADRIEFVQANAEELTSAARAASRTTSSTRSASSTTRRIPSARSREMRALVGAGRDAQADGLPPALVEGLLDRRRRRSAAASGRRDELVAKHSEAQTGCPVDVHVHAPRGARARRARAASGSRTSSVDHVFPYRIRDYVEYRYVKEPYFRWMPEPLFRAFERRFGWHLLITAEAAVAP